MNAVLLLTTDRTYREAAFVEAAARLGVPIILASDTPPELRACTEGRVALDFADTEGATAAIRALAAERPLAAILAVDDSGSLLAASASAALGLPHNAPEAAAAARDKFLMRTLMKRAGVPVPSFRLCSTGDDLVALAHEAPYPCVIKPLRLNGSRGVMRADTPDQFVAAVHRLSALLRSLEPHEPQHPFLIESFIPGFEVALEAILDRGILHILALFDKPDPLDGPFFEETIYVTPSRLPSETQQAISACAAQAAAALGLHDGPLHGELRINEHGPWVVEVAGRSIGGLCAQTLHFGTGASLEELILRQACGLGLAGLEREHRAGGVMMIPIPGAGLLKGVHGVEAACAVAGIESVEISARLNYPLVPLPEGDSYLGFIFARTDTPAEAEEALRVAHAQLRFDIQPFITLF